VIASVSVKNWRSLESLEIPLAPLTALVGPNGAGKSAVLQAIDALLGSRWPGMANLSIPRDFHNLEANKPLSIRCAFDPELSFTDPAGTDHGVAYLEYLCQPYKVRTKHAEAGDLHDDLFALNAKGEKLIVATSRPQKGKKLEFGPLLRVNSGLRDQARVLMISDRRSIAAQASGRRGSILNALLANVRKDYDRDSGGSQTDFRARYDEALSALRTTAVQEIETTIADTAKQMLGFLGSGALSKLDISFGFGDPANPFGSLTMMCREGDLVLPAELMGLGIQSAIVVGVFEALRRQQTNIGTVLIEEPEMYLHPQAQRYFHQLLVDMVDEGQTQVIYTTHSPIFADMTRFPSVRVFEKPAGSPTGVRWISNPADATYLQDQVDRQKLSQYMDPAASEALFARKVLLVEGHGDFLAVRLVARKLEADLDGEGLSVVSCGGKHAIPFFARMCNSLGISALVMHDTDIYELADGVDPTKAQRDEHAKALKDNGEIETALGSPDGIHRIGPCLEAALGIGRSASDKPQKVVEKLEAMEVDDMPGDLVAAVRALIKTD
jgi:putative ATP-dependent endonuclease of OLD family